MQGRGPEAMHGVAEFKLGLAEKLVVRLTGQKPGQAAGFLKVGLLEALVELFGDEFLFGREGNRIHDKPRGEEF